MRSGFETILRSARGGSARFPPSVEFIGDGQWAATSGPPRVQLVKDRPIEIVLISPKDSSPRCVRSWSIRSSPTTVESGQPMPQINPPKKRCSGWQLHGTSWQLPDTSRSKKVWSSPFSNLGVGRLNAMLSCRPGRLCLLTQIARRGPSPREGRDFCVARRFRRGFGTHPRPTAKGGQGRGPAEQG